MTPDEIVFWLFVGCVPAANLYPLFYIFRPWGTTQQGQALMMKALGNVIIIDLSVAYLLFGDYPGRDLLRVVGFSLFFVGINYLLASLIFSENASRYPPWSWFRRRRQSLTGHPEQ